MSGLVAIGYDAKDTAERALATLSELQKGHLITLGCPCLVFVMVS